MGYSRDGGRDLLIVETGNPLNEIAVQVKRRSDPDHTELVSEVREFIGAVAGEQKKAIYVTTARKFSGASVAFATKKTQIGVLNYFELVDAAGILHWIEARRERPA
jgi:restriction endonuclease Mrr